MTDEQFRRLLLMLDGIRIAFLAAIPAKGGRPKDYECSDSDEQSAAALNGMEAIEMRLPHSGPPS